MNNDFWTGFEKRASVLSAGANAAKEVMRVGKSGVRIGGRMDHIGSGYIKNMKNSMPQVKTPGLNATSQPVIKHAGLKDKLSDIIRVGTGDRVRLFGPSKHIGAEHVEKVKEHVAAMDKLYKAVPPKSMSELAKAKYADPKLTPRSIWRKALKAEPQT